jgi:hypothetical protein
MSYGRVNKPRFFVDTVNWLASRGWSKEDEITLESGDWNDGHTKYQLFDLNPLNVCSFNSDGETTEIVINIDTTVTGNLPMDFVAIMNHNLYDAGAFVYFQNDTAVIDDFDATEAIDLTALIGCTAVGGTEAVDFASGETDSIALLAAPATDRYRAIVIHYPVGGFTADITIGSIIVGSHYTLPNSGDLNVNRDFSFDGVTVRSTDAGKRYGHASWVAGNDGNDYAPFRSQAYIRRPGGRQAYDINFSYIADTELFGDDLSDNGTETDFFYQVPNKTAGPLLPFIWTPDSTSTTPGDYMFARLMNDFKPQKVANRVWSFKNRIEEEL